MQKLIALTVLIGVHASVAAGASVSLEQLEEAHIRRIVEQTTSLSEAAQVLGIDQATLYRKRKKMGME